MINNSGPILYVDDYGKTLAELLEMDGYVVVPYTNGREAIKGIRGDWIIR